MKKMNWILLLILALFLTSCSKEYAPVWTAGMNTLGEPVVDVGGLVKDASISKESLVMANLTNYYNSYVKAHKNSGFEMEFEMVDVAPGVKVYLPKSVKYRDEPQFAQLVKPPTKPSDHRVWGTVDNVVNKGLWAFLGWAGFDYLKGTSSDQGTRYYGDPTFNNSFNPGNTGTMTPGPVYNGPYAPVEAPVFFPGGE